MNSRFRRAGVVAFLFLVAATVSHAQSADSVVARHGPIPGRGGIGGQIGSSWIFSEGDYSSGSQPRFSFVGHFRYVLSKHWGWQVSPSFTWNGYVSHVNAPYQDLNFPNEGVSKEFYLTQVIGAAGEIQWFGGPVRKRWHIGAGPAIYRVVIENHRKVVKDPVSLELHNMRHLGFTAEYGREWFLQKLPNTSIELTTAYTQIWARDNVKFISGWNGTPRLLELRLGAHYYYDFRRAKPKSTKPGLGN
jgi:hypothetical protein